MKKIPTGDKKSGQLIKAEEIANRRVAQPLYKIYFKDFGYTTLTVVLIIMIINVTLQVYYR